MRLSNESLTGKLLMIGTTHFLVINVLRVDEKFDAWEIEYITKDGHHSEECSERSIINLFNKIVL